jgi:hypothetical protein
MAYEGALVAIHDANAIDTDTIDADAMGADAIGDAASGSSPQQETEMGIMDAFQTAECCQTSLNSVLHYFLKSLKWKAQAASLQLQEAAQIQGVDSESESESDISSSRTMTRTRKMPGQLFSRVPISLDNHHKHETNTNTEEASCIYMTNTPATGILSF